MSSPLFKYDGDPRDRPVRLVWKTVDVPEGATPLVLVSVEMEENEQPLMFITQVAYEDEIFRAEITAAIESLLVREARKVNPEATLTPPTKAN